MFWKKRTWIDDEIDRVVRVMKIHEPLSAEWLTSCNRLKTLTELKRNSASPVSKDSLVSAGANLLGIVMIISHEHLGPITSKALTFVVRPKV